MKSHVVHQGRCSEEQNTDTDHMTICQTGMPSQRYSVSSNQDEYTIIKTAYNLYCKYTLHSIVPCYTRCPHGVYLEIAGSDAVDGILFILSAVRWMLPLCGARGYVPVVGARAVPYGAPSWRQVRVQLQILVCPDIICPTHSSISLENLG